MAEVSDEPCTLACSEPFELVQQNCVDCGHELDSTYSDGLRCNYCDRELGGGA